MSISPNSAPRPIPKSALTHLDLLRGAAAALVLANHVRGLFFVDWEQLYAPSLAMKLLYLWTGIGHECVILFFVLSGFFIGYSVLAAQRAGTWDWGSYGLRRFSRLYVVLVPGLLLTAVLDRSGMALFGADHGIYAGKIDAPHMMLSDANVTTTAPIFIGNLCFLQSLKLPEYGTNAPLWSLPYEFWYYVSFPLIVRAAVRAEPPARRALFVFAVLGLVAFFGKNFGFYLVVWGMGALVALAWLSSPKWLVAPWRALGPRLGAVVLALVTAVFVGVLVAARARALPTQMMNDFALGIATAMLVWTAIEVSSLRAEAGAVIARPTLAWRGYAQLSKLLARFSFTLYVVHFPVLVFLHAWLGIGARWWPDAAHLARGAALFWGVMFLVALPLSMVTERKPNVSAAGSPRRAPFLRSSKSA